MLWSPEDSRRSVSPFLITGDTLPFWVAERPYRELLNREDQAGRVGGFPKSEKAIRGIPEALSVFRGCADARKS